MTLPAAGTGPEPVATPGMTTISDVAAHLDLEPGALLKAYPVVVADAEGGERLVLVIVRGDHRVGEIKLANTLGATPRQARVEEIEAALGPAGFIGPVGVGADVEILLDAGAAGFGAGGYVAGAERPDEHLRGVEPGRDFAYREVDVREVGSGDTIAGSAITIEPAIEVGNIFKLGTRYSEPLGRALPGRARGGAADLDGLLRDRPGAHRRRRRRAVRRRARHLLAAGARAVRRAPGRARQARARPSATLPTRCTRRCSRAGWTCSTTTATPAPARSSPTPSCWAARCG